MKKHDWILALIAATALIIHFWPMAYWSGLTLVVLRLTVAFFAQLYLCRRNWALPVRLLPLLGAALLALWGGWLFCMSPVWADASFAGYFWDYCSPALGCAAAWLVVWLRKRLSWGQLFGGAFLFCVLVVPACIGALLALGWPPVIGNITAARAMTQYATRVHPDWEAESGWAGYNLVDGSHYLNFCVGEERYTLRSNWNGTSILDDERERALRKELGVDGAIRSVSPPADDPYGYVFWSARWSVKETETPHIFLRVDLSDGSDAPLLDWEQMVNKMADRGMEVYEALSPLAPPDKFAVHYTHWGADRREEGGQRWYQITVELRGAELTRARILGTAVTTNGPTL